MALHPNTPSDFKQSIVQFLGKRDARAQKVGLQRLCALLESSGSSEYRRRLFGRELFDCYDSSSEKVRLWAYKATALLRDERLKPNLVAAIRTDGDEDARSWAISALASIDMPVLEALDRRHGLFAGELQKQIQTTFFRSVTNPIIVPTSLHTDVEGMTLRWILSAYGEKRITLNPELYSSLLCHNDWEVRQYCHWAHVKRKTCSIQTSAATARFVEVDPRVVRWQLRALFVAPGANSDRIGEVIKTVSIETDYSIRESLALGLADAASIFSGFNDAICAWHSVEASNLIRDLLLEYLVRIAFKDRSVTNYLNDLIHYNRSSDESTTNRIICALSLGGAHASGTTSRARSLPIILNRSYHDMSQNITVQGTTVTDVTINAVSQSPKASITPSPKSHVKEIQELFAAVLSDVDLGSRRRITRSIADKVRHTPKSAGSGIDDVINGATKRLSQIGVGVDKIAKIQAGLQKILIPFFGDSG